MGGMLDNFTEPDATLINQLNLSIYLILLEKMITHTATAYQCLCLQAFHVKFIAVEFTSRTFLNTQLNMMASMS